MKKRFFSILALTLVCIFSLSACDGCFSLQPINFTNAFNGGSGLKVEDNPKTNYQEVLTYDVDYFESFDGYSISNKLKANEKFNVKFENGKYVSTLKILSSFGDANVKLESDIIDSLENNQMHAYYLHTEFSIDVTYDIEDRDPYTHTDTIVSDVYFCDVSLSYAPIYSKTTADYTNLRCVEKIYAVSDKTFSEVKYSKNSYTVSFTANNKETKVTTNDYEYKTIIDNAQLLFAIRNFPLELETTESMPVVGYNFGEAVSLAINKDTTSTISYQDNPLIYGLANYSGNVETSRYRFYRNKTNETGVMQNVYIQNNVENSDIAYKSLLIRYVEPLSSVYGDVLSLGALVYTLRNVQVG